MRAGALCRMSGKQQMGQQEAGEIVDGEAKLVAVGAGLARAAPAVPMPALLIRMSSRSVRCRTVVGKPPHLGQGREVGGEEFRRTARLLDIGDDAVAALLVAAVHQDAGAGLAKPAGHHAADAVGRAGDECGLSGQFRHAGPPSRLFRSDMAWHGWRRHRRGRRQGDQSAVARLVAHRHAGLCPAIQVFTTRASKGVTAQVAQELIRPA